MSDADLKSVVVLCIKDYPRVWGEYFVCDLVTIVSPLVFSVCHRLQTIVE